MNWGVGSDSLALVDGLIAGSGVASQGLETLCVGAWYNRGVVKSRANGGFTFFPLIGPGVKERGMPLERMGGGVEAAAIAHCTKACAKGVSVS